MDNNFSISNVPKIYLLWESYIFNLLVSHKPKPEYIDRGKNKSCFP